MDDENKIFDFILKTNVKSGIGSIYEIPNFLIENNYKRIGFVIDGNLINSIKSIGKLIDICKKEFESVIIHQYFENFEPTYQYLDLAKLEFKRDKESLVDCIIGIGGGSAIDLSKGISTLITNHKNSITYRGFPEGLNLSIPVIAVPSTAGTGTELAYNAVFIDEDTNTKLGINTPNNYPALSILDPEIVATAPKKVVIGSGIGALIRTFETLVSPKANMVSRTYSKQAYELIQSSLPRVLKDNNLHYWSNMQWGAYYSMAALSNSTSGPAGAISYYLSTKYNIPQGYGYGISGLKIAEYNIKQGYEGYSFLFDMFKDQDNLDFDEKSKSNLVIDKTKQLFTDIGVQKLSDFGLNNNDFDAFINFCKETAKVAFTNNPIIFNHDILELMIYEMITGK